MRFKTISFLTSLIISGTFFFFILIKPNFFNILPVSIYHAFDKAGKYEYTFIIVFYIIVTLLIAAAIYKLIHLILAPTIIPGVSDFRTTINVEKHIAQKQMNDEQIIEHIDKIEGLGGMTVNERLYVTGLSDEFYKTIKTDKARARKILTWIKVDEPSIISILEMEK